MEQIGGKLLGNGSIYTTLFKPSIQCKNKRYNRKNKNVSKIFYGNDSYYDSKSEFFINKLIKKKIHNYNKYFFIWEKLCKPPPYKVILKHDKDIKSCIQEEGITEDIFNKRSIMLIGKYAGINLLSSWIEDSNKEHSLIKLINKYLIYIYQILFSILELKKINISHNDIHCKNIMILNNRARLIDFGISDFLSRKTFISERSYELLGENRYFIPIPPDILFSELYNFKNVKKYTDLVGYEILNIFHKNILNESHFNQKIQSVFNSFKTKQKKELHNKNQSYQKLDVYSIGLIFPHLIYEYYTTKMKNDIKTMYTNYKHLCNNYEYINDFISLFRNMANINVEERYTINKAFKIYTELLKTNKLL
tara:strand:+ start:921 stop:2012 length:1092 start_codon:yes stop_codon:yes gene_type:complete